MTSPELSLGDDGNGAKGWPGQVRAGRESGHRSFRCHMRSRYLRCGTEPGYAGDP